MARVNIIEKTEADAIIEGASQFFQPIIARSPAIPAAYDGKYVCLLAVAVDTEVSESQMDSLETAIEGISGVHKAFCLIGPARIPLDRTPSGYDLKIGVKGSFVVKPTV